MTAQKTNVQKMNTLFEDTSSPPERPAENFVLEDATRAGEWFLRRYAGVYFPRILSELREHARVNEPSRHLNWEELARQVAGETSAQRKWTWQTDASFDSDDYARSLGRLLFRLLGREGVRALLRRDPHVECFAAARLGREQAEAPSSPMERSTANV